MVGQQLLLLPDFIKQYYFTGAVITVIARLLAKRASSSSPRGHDRFVARAGASEG